MPLPLSVDTDKFEHEESRSLLSKPSNHDGRSTGNFAFIRNAPRPATLIAFSALAVTALIGTTMLISKGAPSYRTAPDLYFASTKTSKIGKYTWASTKPTVVKEWFLEHLPTTAWTGDSDASGTCVTYGKVYLGESNSSSVNSNGLFQLHAVDAWARPSGLLSVGVIEERFDASVSDFSSWHPLLETSMGLYTSDLGYYAEKWASAGLDFMVLMWPHPSGEGEALDTDGGLTNARDGDDGEDDEYSLPTAFSLIAHVPNTTINIEVIGRALNISAISSAYTRLVSHRRYASTMPPSNHEDTTVNGMPAMTAIKVSYASTNATRDATFFENVLGASLLLSESNLVRRASGYGYDTTSGTQLRAVSFDDWVSNSLEYHFVQFADGADDDGLVGDADSGFTVGELERLFTDAHDTYLLNYTYGFDRELDWHFGARLGDALPLTSFIDAAKAEGASYELFTGPTSSSDSTSAYMYVALPGGQGAQLVGTLTGEYADLTLREFDTCSAV